MVAFSKFARGVAVFAYLAQAESNSAAIPEAVANVSDLMDEKVEAVKEAVDPIDDELDALDEEQGGDSEDAALDKVRELLKKIMSGESMEDIEGEADLEALLSQVPQEKLTELFQEMLPADLMGGMGGDDMPMDLPTDMSDDALDKMDDDDEEAATEVDGDAAAPTEDEAAAPTEDDEAAANDAEL
ncbi:unnamed protein product [Amoebophrya sp. A25]|nr:unnamed protein product [Amoebophrya sp. A25]|eukprot:GSA25T00023236001.1